MKDTVECSKLRSQMQQMTVSSRTSIFTIEIGSELQKLLVTMSSSHLNLKKIIAWMSQISNSNSVCWQVCNRSDWLTDTGVQPPDQMPMVSTIRTSRLQYSEGMFCIVQKNEQKILGRILAFVYWEELDKFFGFLKEYKYYFLEIAVDMFQDYRRSWQCCQTSSDQTITKCATVRTRGLERRFQCGSCQFGVIRTTKPVPETCQSK